jgi:streptogramin lyase
MITKENKFIQLILIILGVFLLSGCNTNQNLSDFECLPTQKSFSYPVDTWTGKPTPTLVSPNYNSWQLQLRDQRLSNPSQVIARGDDQIWMLDQNMMLYTKNDKQLKQYFITRNGEMDTPQTLFLSKDGTLWAMGSRSGIEGPLLSRYNDKTDKFETIIDSGKLLQFDGSGGGEITEDSNNRLWFVLYGYGVYVFDPKNNSAKKILSQDLADGSIIVSIAVDSKDGLWLGTQTKTFGNDLVYYDTKTLILSNLFLRINEEEPIRGLLIDNNNRLWISDYAYWIIGTPLPTEDRMGINLIIRSPVFISQHSPRSDYAWLRPKVLIEDSDGNIWYTSFGLVRFNPKIGEWCKVFDSDALEIGVTEDNQGYFWTVTDGKLYNHN